MSLEMLPPKPRAPQKKRTQTLYPSCTLGSWRTPMTLHLLPLQWQFERTEKMATQNGVPAACERVASVWTAGVEDIASGSIKPSIGHLQL